MDTIPNEIYQHIFSYVLGDYDVNSIVQKNAYINLKLVNETFKDRIETYLKTTPLFLIFDGTEMSLKLVTYLKRYGVSNKYHLELCLRYLNRSDCNPKRLGTQFDLQTLELLCKELKCITLHVPHSIVNDIVNGKVDDNDMKIIAEKWKFLLYAYKHSLESLYFIGSDRYDIFPNDLRSWPNLKQLEILNCSMEPKTIESSTLEFLQIFAENSLPDNIVIKCPNLKVLLIGSNNFDARKIEMEDRSSCNPYDENDRRFTKTCHPSELQKFGMVVEVSPNCDIGIMSMFWAFTKDGVAEVIRY